MCMSIGTLQSGLAEGLATISQKTSEKMQQVSQLTGDARTAAVVVCVVGTCETFKYAWRSWRQPRIQHVAYATQESLDTLAKRVAVVETGKANNNDLTSLQQVVQNKADKTDLTSLTSDTASQKIILANLHEIIHGDDRGKIGLLQIVQSQKFDIPDSGSSSSGDSDTERKRLADMTMEMRSVRLGTEEEKDTDKGLVQTRVNQYPYDKK